MVFQSFNLWSHMTVIENIIEAPVHVQKRPRADAVREGLALLDKVGIADKREPIPRTCREASSSARQSRGALAMHPRVMLVRRADLRARSRIVGEVLRVIAHAGAEADDAGGDARNGFRAEVSNRVIFLNRGRIEEEGKPADLVSQRRRPSGCANFSRSHLRPSSRLARRALVAGTSGSLPGCRCRRRKRRRRSRAAS
jgi:octopine/nopaline transport system ATP-binding protein